MVNRENRFGVDNKEGIDPEDEPLDEGGWLVFSRWHSEHKKYTWDEFEAQIRKKGLDSIKYYEQIQYLKTKKCKTLMEDNEITIHVATDYILLDGECTDKKFYQCLELQMDDDKRTIETALRYSGLLRGFLNNYLASEIGTEEQWELDAGAFVYSKFCVGAYNASYLTLNRKDPIYCKHTRGMRGDDMLETMNKNNWHEFLDSTIHGALTGARGDDNPWIKRSLRT